MPESLAARLDATVDYPYVYTVSTSIYYYSRAEHTYMFLETYYSLNAGSCVDYVYMVI